MIVAPKYNPLYHIGVVPLLRDYARGMSFRSIAATHGVCYTTAREIVAESGAKIRQNDGTVYEDRRKDLIEAAAEEYKSGAGVRTIEAKYAIGPSVFKRYLEARGVAARCAQIQRHPHLTESNRSAVAEDFRCGMCMADIAKKHGLKRSSVKTLLRHAGLRRRSRNEIAAITKYNSLGTRNIPGFIISQWKGAAKNRGMEWNLTPEYLQAMFEKQNGRCYYTGMPLAVRVRRHDRTAVRVDPQRMSLDRVDSSGGYTMGNVVLCSAFANYAKTDLPADQFISLLKIAGEYQASLAKQP